MFRYKPARQIKTEPIGSGSYGAVYPYKTKDGDPTKLCVKIMQTTNFTQYAKFIQEGVLGFSLDHEALLKVEGIHCAQKDKLFFQLILLLPRMETSLDKIILERQKTRANIPEETLLGYFHTLTCGLEYIHSKKIAHRDIKPANILLDSNGKVKLADIGLAHFIGDDQTQTMDNGAGTLPYIAPEVMNLNQTRMKNKELSFADLWSLGVVMLELCLLDMCIISSEKPIEEIQKRVGSLLGLARKRYREEIVELISIMLSINPRSRKTAKEIRGRLEALMGKPQVNIDDKVNNDSKSTIKVEERKAEDQPKPIDYDKLIHEGKSFNIHKVTLDSLG